VTRTITDPFDAALMALERLDGTFSAGANISIGKAKTAVMFKKPTRFFEELINSSGKGRTVMTALENFTPLIGGIPTTWMVRLSAAWA
jgi:glc operon protein GlcG